MEFFNVKKLPVTITSIPPMFCSNDSSSKMKLFITGYWNPIAMLSKTPHIKISINKTTDLFNWVFSIGSKKIPHKYETWSKTNKVNNTNIFTNLPDLDWDLQKKPAFNLSLSCSNFPTFVTELNFWDPSNDPNGLERESSSWDSETLVDANVDYTAAKEVVIDGGISVDYAGFTSEGCLSLTPTGLVVPGYGVACSASLDTVCEYQSCYTQEGAECIFPFPYKDVTYHNCTSEDVYQPWCATGNLYFLLIYHLVTTIIIRAEWYRYIVLGALPSRLSSCCS